jgi:hypothetical protein
MQLQITAAAVGAKMMYDLLDTPASETDSAGATDLVVRSGEVRFDKVGFAYKRDTPVLTDLSFLAPAGVRPRWSARRAAVRPPSSICCRASGCPSGAPLPSTARQLRA